MGPIATGLGEIFMYTVEPSPARTKAGREALRHRPTSHERRTGSCGRSCACARGDGGQHASAATKGSSASLPIRKSSSPTD